MTVKHQEIRMPARRSARELSTKARLAQFKDLLETNRYGRPRFMLDQKTRMTVSAIAAEEGKCAAPAKKLLRKNFAHADTTEMIVGSGIGGGIIGMILVGFTEDLAKAMHITVSGVAAVLITIYVIGKGFAERHREREEFLDSLEKIAQRIDRTGAP